MADVARIHGSDDLDIVQVTRDIGAEVRGVRLDSDLAPDVVDSIWAALVRHKVLFFRDQSHLDDASQEAFAARLGRPVAHPIAAVKAGTETLWEMDSDDGLRANSWHTDITFLEAYPAASILRAVQLPALGGDTQWANTTAAYESLPPELRTLADSLRAVHTSASDYSTVTYSKDMRSSGGFRARQVETEHPLVRVHPVTGERTLLLGHFFKRFVGIPSAVSNQLFTIFQSYITRPENIVRWHWRVNDVAIWDNKATQHYALNDYEGRRVMSRVTVAGDVPVGVDGRSSILLSDSGLAVAAE